MRAIKRFIKTILEAGGNENGQAVVEFALALPLLLTILCGILDYGWIFSNQYKAEYAAYNGARYASINAVNLSDGEIQQGIIQTVEDNLPGGSVTVNVNYSSRQVVINVEYPVKTLTFVASTIYGEYYNAEAVKYASF